MDQKIRDEAGGKLQSNRQRTARVSQGCWMLIGVGTFGGWLAGWLVQAPKVPETIESVKCWAWRRANDAMRKTHDRGDGKEMSSLWASASTARGWQKWKRSKVTAFPRLAVWSS